MQVDRLSLPAILLAACLACGGMPSAHAASASAWKPDKPIQFAVLSSPGGGNDKTARLMQRIWRESKWLENVNVLNRPGGGGAVAYTYVSLMSSSVDAVVPHHKSGTMRILGLATPERSPGLPGVPTLRDQGYDIVMGNWTAIMGPKGLTPAQIAFWEELLERTFNHPAWKGMLEAEALEADFKNSQALRELLVRDYELERKMLTELVMAK